MKVGGTEPTSQQACGHECTLDFVLSAMRNVYAEKRGDVITFKRNLSGC